MLVYSQSFAVKSCCGDTLYYKLKVPGCPRKRDVSRIVYRTDISFKCKYIIYKRDGCAMRITDRFSAVADK